MLGLNDSASGNKQNSQTAVPDKRRHKSMPRGMPPMRKYGLSVTDTVKLGSKKTAQMGIEGYEMK